MSVIVSEIHTDGLLKTVSGERMISSVNMQMRDMGTMLSNVDGDLDVSMVYRNITSD